MSARRFGRSQRYDAVVVGAGPNGLAAGIELCRAGLSTLLIEAKPTPGGGARTAQLTLPGHHHDVCSTVHPLGVASPFFRSLSLERYGVSWCDSPLALVHVLSDGSAATLSRSLDATAQGLGADHSAYHELMSPLVARADELFREVLGPLRVPRAPLLLARFGLLALPSLAGFARRHFAEPATRALLAGMGAHAMQPLHLPATASFALVLALSAHVAGWPLAQGGSQSITRALVRCFEQLGGELALRQPVRSHTELPQARAYLYDLTPRQLLHVVGERWPAGYRARLRRFRYGPGVFKMDWALAGPVPWLDARCRQAATVHLAGTLEDVARAEAAVSDGSVAEHPFVIFVQPSLFDSTRAPPGQHVAWAYCHVPLASKLDASTRIEAQIERFAPGFRDLIVARHTTGSEQLERYDENYVGGDINGGSAVLSQLFTRPVARLDPYSTPAPDVFICSSSTPPGGGVHGMCGYWAARSALERRFQRQATPLWP